MTAIRRASAAILFSAATAVLAAGQTGPASKTFTQDQLYQRDTVWTAELTFSADQWAAMAPKRHEPTGRPARVEWNWLQGREGDRNGWGSALGWEFEYVHADLTFGGVQYKNVAVRIKGNGSFGGANQLVAKNSLKIDLNKYEKGQKIAGVSTLNFHNAKADASWMSEVLSYRLYQDAGVEAPRTSYVRVYLNVAGQPRRYAGLFSMIENVDGNFLETHYKTKSGALLKPVTMLPFDDMGNDWAKYNQTYDPKEDLTDAEKARVIEFCKFVTHAADPDFAARVGNYVDLDQFARYMAVVVWINNHDSILWNGQNYYVFMPRSTGKMVFVPWDQDFSFDNFPASQPPGTAAAGSIYKPWPQMDVPFLVRMWKVPAFRTRYLAELTRLNGTVFDPARFPPQMEQLAKVIRPNIPDEPPRQQTQRYAAGVNQVELFERLMSADKGLILPYTTARAASVAAQLAAGK